MKKTNSSMPKLRPVFVATSSILAASIACGQQAPAGSGSSAMLDEAMVLSGAMSSKRTRPWRTTYWVSPEKVTTRMP